MDKFSIVNMPSQTGRVAIITGANAGIGYETAKGLISKGAHVIMACRNKEKAELAFQALQSELPKSSLEIILLDLADKDSIEQFVKEFKSRHNRLDLLINNAGVMTFKYRETSFGYESQWGINFLGHFYLTGLLMPIILETEHARVITLSSLAHRTGEIYWDDVNRKDNFKGMELYRQSKLADLIFAYELQRRFEEKGKSQKSLACHPGVSMTELFDAAPKWVSWIAPLFKGMFNTVPDAAKPTLMAAMDETLVGGEYLGPTDKREMKGEPGIVRSASRAQDLQTADKLWSMAEEMMGIDFAI